MLYNAWSVWVSWLAFLFKGVIQLAITLNEESEDHILAASTWALGQIGRHSAEHSKAVATANVLPQLLKFYLNPESSNDLQSKVIFTT